MKLSRFHAILALKGHLDVPLEWIDRVETASAIAFAGPEGIRNPGIGIPYLLHAGSYSSGEKRTFWDVQNASKAISIWLKSEMTMNIEDRYNQIVVEVDNPGETIMLIESALVG